MDTLQINGNQKVSAADAAPNPSFENPPPSVEISDYILIKTTGPFDAEQLEALKAANVELLEYKGDEVYLCGYKPKTLTPVIEGLSSFVTHAEVYHPGYVVDPVLKTGDPEDATDVHIVLHDDVNNPEVLNQVKQDIASLTGQSATNIEIEDGTVLVSVPRKKLEKLAEIDQVRTIDEYKPAGLLNNKACDIMEAHVPTTFPGQPTTTYKGAGQIVCVADTGFDTGVKDKCHAAFGKRVDKLYPLGLGRTEQYPACDPDGHGTHVCGSVLGKGIHASQGLIESPASEAHLFVQSLFSGWKNTENNPARLWRASLDALDKIPYSQLFGVPAKDGARIHTNSYGIQNEGCTYVDIHAYKIDEYLWKDHDLVVLFSAGNEGVDKRATGHVDESSLCRQACAKNAIVVGASESERDYKSVSYWGQENALMTWGAFRYPDSDKPKFPEDPIISDDVANNREGLAAFSSRGPVLPSGMIKPDVVAPGTTILSTRSSAIKESHWTDGWGKSTDTTWCYSGGTSMATPLVAGCCAVIRGAVVDKAFVEPSAALIKALLINGAVPLKGQYKKQVAPNTEFGRALDIVPNPHYGFGRVNVKNSLQHLVSAGDGSKTAGFDDRRQSKALTISQKEYNFNIAIPSNVKPTSTLKITLVWNDPPGANLQHDLDLILSNGSGVEKHGNMGDGTGFDRVNNVEQITWKNVQPDTTYKATVRLYRGDDDPAPYAYAWRIFNE